MPITTDRNPVYGPPNVNQKYRPLDSIDYTSETGPFFSALLTNRINLLTTANLLPQPLGLAVPNWNTIIRAEAVIGQRPPLVVISSNRSNWIVNGLNSANAELSKLNIPNYANASDLRALQASDNQTSSPPIYCPTRIGNGGPRNVYVVVHIREYNKYKNALAAVPQLVGGPQITVVGWQFQPPPAPAPPTVPHLNLTGFGASRYAAIEFCKHLRTTAGAPWNYAWLFDDNTVALTGFAGYLAVENAITPAHVCAGFNGGTKAIPFVENKNWAIKEIKAGRGGQAAALPASITPNIVQQASLWNIAYLTNHHLNFSPIYVSSAEDLSIGNYFDSQNIPYLWYKGIGVRKELTETDGGTEARFVNNARQYYTTLFSNAEAAVTALPPPPVLVRPVNAADGGVQPLANFVVARVLPNSLMKDLANDAAVQNTAKCQAVEQITCGAIKSGLVSPAALNATFQINGPAGNQVIIQRDVP